MIHIYDYFFYLINTPQHTAKRWDLVYNAWLISLILPYSPTPAQCRFLSELFYTHSSPESITKYIYGRIPLFNFSYISFLYSVPTLWSKPYVYSFSSSLSCLPLFTTFTRFLTVSFSSHNFSSIFSFISSSSSLHNLAILSSVFLQVVQTIL